MQQSKAEYGALVGREVERVANIAGGDIGDSVRLECADGTRYFAKRYRGGASDMAAAEASGLDWLAQANALRVPKVIATTTESSPQIVLEWIEQKTPAPGFDEALGRGLAAVHAAGAPGYGFHRDNFIGTLPQRNRAHTRWSEFYAHERITPQVERAKRAGLIPKDLDRALTRLIDTMDEHCGPEVGPARLHGDVWSGNLIADERGQPCLVDPAVYGGHPEVDLAMMRLFGGFKERVFDVYREAASLPPGFEERTRLWQLYPLLVHVNLFGGTYVNSVAEAIRGFV